MVYATNLRGKNSLKNCRKRYLNKRLPHGMTRRAEIAKLNEERGKVYRDNYRILETAKKEGASEKAVEIAVKHKKRRVSVNLLADSTGLTK